MELTSRCLEVDLLRSKSKVVMQDRDGSQVTGTWTEPFFNNGSSQNIVTWCHKDDVMLVLIETINQLWWWWREAAEKLPTTCDRLVCGHQRKVENIKGQLYMQVTGDWLRNNYWPIAGWQLKKCQVQKHIEDRAQRITILNWRYCLIRMDFSWCNKELIVR